MKQLTLTIMPGTKLESDAPAGAGWYMLWRGDLAEAVEYYRAKYGEPPTVIYVRPERVEHVPGVRVIGDECVSRIDALVGVG